MSNYKFTVLAISGLLAVLAVSQTTLARQAFFGTKLTDPAEQQTTSSENGLKMQFSTTDSPISSCLSGYYYLPSSNTYVETEWDMSFRQRNSSGGQFLPIEQMVDLNGDGLVDYQYVYINETDSTFEYRSCVYLNTGSGFERVHQCYAWLVEAPSGDEIGTQTYYGDCAG